MQGQHFKITLPTILVCMAFYLILLPFIQYPITTLLKPIPIALLMLFSWQVTVDHSIRILLLIALGFSLGGDIVLTMPFKNALPIGILAFMGTHCTYIRLFFKKGQLQGKNVIAFSPILVFIIMGGVFLWPYLGEMEEPVTIYLGLLTLMVFFAFQVKRQSTLIRLGACLFLLSDFLLALDLFVLPSIKLLTVLIMLIYFMAQLLLIVGSTQPNIQKLHAPSSLYS